MQRWVVEDSCDTLLTSYDGWERLALVDLGDFGALETLPFLTARGCAMLRALGVADSRCFFLTVAGKMATGELRDFIKRLGGDERIAIALAEKIETCFGFT